MIGREKPLREKLFYEGFSLEERVRKDHPLRAIKRAVDFDFIYQEVADEYRYNGNVSVPPSIILKLMFLLFFYDVPSERELIATIPERLDWLWFLGYNLDDKAPDHSVLSKARKRWGKEVFKAFFVRVVRQCVALGLVAGDKLFCDASLVDADEANDSIRENVKFDELYGQLEKRLSEVRDEAVVVRSGEGIEVRDKHYISDTDLDASVVQGRGGSRARYKEHRAVDGRFGVITAIDVTSGDINEAHRLRVLKEQHEVVTGYKVKTAIADSKYGTIDNYLYCYDHRISAHIPDMKEATAGSGRKKGIFSTDEFKYLREEDVYIYTSGVRLERKRYHKRRDAYDYCAPKEACLNCPFRSRCTKSRSGRSIKRHIRQDDLDAMRQGAASRGAWLDLKRRQHLAEGSFADAANNHGFKRARRRLWRVQIQSYLIAAIQNIRIMIKHILYFEKGKSSSKEGVKSFVFVFNFSFRLSQCSHF
jgi:transposase